MIPPLKKKHQTVNSKVMRKVSFLILTMFFTLGAMAQEVVPAQKTFWDDPVNDPLLPVYLLTTFVFVVIILVAFVAMYLIKILNMLTSQAEQERAQRLGISFMPKVTWWEKFLEKVNARVPMEKEKEIELDHNYDGIRELDNHLPPWWKWLFYGTIVFALVYIVVYHFTDSLPLQEQEYQQEVAQAEAQAQKFQASQPKAVIDENALVYVADAALIAKGKVIFTNNNCGSCHRNDGGGNAIGPNLTDEYWIHGGDVKQIFLTIKNGVVEKGMPAWGKSMSPQDVKDVTFFVMSMLGSNPANAKAPQGDLYNPAPVEAPVATDSTKAQASL